MKKGFFNYHTIEIAFAIEVLFIVGIVLLICIMHVIISLRLKKSKKTERILKELFLKAITENKIPLDKILFPHLYSLPIAVTIIRDISSKVKEGIWKELKIRVIRRYLYKKIEKSLCSRSWKKRSWALQALALAPGVEDEVKIISFLKDKTPAVRFSAAAVAIKIKTQSSINAILEEMAGEETYARYPYRDLLVSGDSEVFSLIQNRFQETKDVSIRICALEILSQKIGYIHLDMLRKDLSSENQELRWWAIRALENCPSDESIEILINQALKGDDQLRSIAIQSLGTSISQKALPIFEKLLRDCSRTIRIQAAIGLRKLGDIGVASLKNIYESGHEEASEAASYVLSLPINSLDLETVKWFRYY